MDRIHGIHRYTSRRFVDGGYEGYQLFDFVDEEVKRLFRLPDRENTPVARVYYADALGVYCVEIFDNTQLPVEIIEELIAETKENVKYM